MNMKILMRLAPFFLLMFASALRAEPHNIRLTVTAGVPVQVSDQHIQVHSIMIQMRTGGTGRGYVLRVKPGVTPDATNGAHLSGELYPASATAPGGAWSDNDVTPQLTRKFIYLDWIWCDGFHTGDEISVTYDTY